jgi:hypothetical protein
MEDNYFCCALCNYKTKRKFDLKRHHNALHLKNELKENDKINVIQKNDNVNQKNDNVNQKNDNVNQKNDNVNQNEDNVFYCKKCNKKYKQKKYLLNHEEKCIGINILTCPKCMFTFSSRISKSAHIKRNNCKAKSIIHATKPDIMINCNNTTNNTINNINNTINNNTIINNYGSERTDYITFDDMIKIIRLGFNTTIPKYIELKHFNKDFPENHNIKYEKNNDCYVKKNGEWKITNIDYLSKKLLNTNYNEINKFYYDKKEKIEENIQNIEIIDIIYKRLNYLDLQVNKKMYKDIRYEIKDMIRTTKINN